MEYNLIYKLLFIVIFIFMFLSSFHVCTLNRYNYDNTRKIKKKITIAMLCTPNYMDIGKNGINYITKYCKQFGYTFKLYTESLVPDLHIQFTKFELAKNELSINDADYIVVIDADTYNPNLSEDEFIPIENIIEYAKDKDIMAPKDVLSNIGSIVLKSNSTINSGFVIYKNTDVSLQFCKDMISSAKNECSKFKDIHPRDQNVFDHCLKEKYMKYVGFIPWQIAGVRQSLFFPQSFATASNRVKIPYQDFFL